ncbi:multiubiquitin domain-containing protein [Candidatus Poriferisodalis sp.]|uniref:multiubiquitin domain-containing protein n=1 Tax=Candidatus Poriferisodalis sp. TaxID=3101277 RepID=UPI003B020B7D
MADSAETTAGGDRKRPVPIEVNNKPVKVDGPTATGLQIKQAAIDQGVSIQLDFHLSVIGGDGKEVRVNDDESVELHRDLKFFAVAGDDNS